MAAAALLLAACAPAPPAGAPAAATLRDRLLGALPPEEAARGVYAVDLNDAGELSPGSRVGPVATPLLDDADLLVETAAPPVVLLGGVSDVGDLPDAAVRVEDVVVFAAAADTRDAIVRRLRSNTAPAGALADMAAADAPVAWTGPTPAPGADGTTIVTVSPSSVRFAVSEATTPQAEEHARRVLAEGGPAGSPGKRWTTILGDATVTSEDDRLVITATPEDLPGLLLRVLIDQRQVTFLPG